MFGKDISQKIEEVLLKSSKIYFHENLPSKTFPGGIEELLQITKDSKHGDLTSNIAMRLASHAAEAPAELGKGILKIFHDQLAKTGLSGLIGEVELKGGFMNFRLSEEYYSKLLVNIQERGENFGRSNEGHSQHVNLEFVSAMTGNVSPVYTTIFPSRNSITAQFPDLSLTKK